jgi:DNA-binding NarL/FixJ family response regulator
MLSYVIPGVAATLIYGGGDLAQATRLIGAGDALREEIGAPIYAGVQALFDRAHAALIRALGVAAFDALRAEDHALSFDAAVTLALAQTGDGSAREQPLPAGLSPREAEVLKLLAAGNSNMQISRTLTLSVRTVERHIGNIYLKIDAHNRTGATAFAHRHGLA